MNLAQKVVRTSLERQMAADRDRLLFTPSELDEAALAYGGSEDFDEIERYDLNIIAAHKNFLRFTSEGIKRARAAYADDAPEWWRLDQALQAKIAEDRGRMRSARG